MQGRVCNRGNWPFFPLPPLAKVFPPSPQALSDRCLVLVSEENKLLPCVMLSLELRTNQDQMQGITSYQ